MRMTRAEQAWQRRVPRSLREAHDKILALHFGVRRTRDYGMSGNAADFAWEIVRLIEDFDAAAAAMGLVEDEFAAVATEVPDWDGTYGSSWHELVLEHSRIIWAVIYQVTKDRFPDTDWAKRVYSLKERDRR